MDDEQRAGVADLENDGVLASDLVAGGKLVGRVGADEVLLARSGDRVLAIGARCTHQGGPLVDGLVVGDTVRCPWHHACFSLENGDAACAPALDPVDAWNVKEVDGRLFVAGKKERVQPAPVDGAPARVVIVGAGPAGNACAEMLRREGYAGTITLIGAEYALPYDRPKLSKEYLAGTADDHALPLRPREFYSQKRIELFVGARVTNVDLKQRQVITDNGRMRGFDALVLATGAAPNKLTIHGHDQPHVLYLRSVADSRVLSARAANAKSIVILGASFIGLEVAASLRRRGLEVHVVAPSQRPLGKVLGPALGDWVRALHEKEGVHFHLGDEAGVIQPDKVYTRGGEQLAADLVVVAMGVKPVVTLAEQMGLSLAQDGVAVDEYLESSVPGVYAIGDLAAYKDASGERARIEHFAVAERQGQTAARNILGNKTPFRAVPFFWSSHYDATISYVGHAASWDAADVVGDLAANDAAVVYRKKGKLLAVATVNRDALSLAVEAAMERGEDPSALLA